LRKSELVKVARIAPAIGCFWPLRRRRKRKGRLWLAGVARYRINQQVRAPSASSATLSCGHGDAKLNRVVLGVRRARAPNVAFGQHLAPELEQTQGNQRREDLRDNEDAKHRPQEVA
jgi:hypothetical protein